VNTTYTQVWQNCDLHWKYSKSYLALQFIFPWKVLPIPFRPLYYFTSLIYQCKRPKIEGFFKEYKQTLVRIISLMMEHHAQNTSDTEQLKESEISGLRREVADLKDLIQRKL